MKRVQRKRTKGWRMPENTVYVGRPSRWGNPFPVDEYGRDDSLKQYASWLGRQVKRNPTFLDPLREKDLACWCRPFEKCHADILLQIVQMEIAKAKAKQSLLTILEKSVLEVLLDIREILKKSDTFLGVEIASFL